MSRGDASFKNLLVMDCETTGLCFTSKSPVFNPDSGEHHQAVSWGLIVADTETLQPVEKLYLEIKWNEESKRQQIKNSYFGRKAEEIHGLTQAHLESEGLTEEEAVVKIAELIIKYWGFDSCIRTLGHNVHMFDLPFFQDLLERHDVHMKFGSRHYDTNSAGFMCFKTWTSNELFEMVGFNPREAHNALEDAEMALGTARIIRLISLKALGEM